LEAFRQGLRELGYVEGQNICLEPRYAGGRVERVAGLAAELVRLKVDVIVASGPHDPGRCESDRHDPDRYVGNC
jgi:putative ABC transport system substrate-binding protein